MATDYTYDIEVSKDKIHATLAIELPERTMHRDPVLEVDDHNAMDIMRENGFNSYHLVTGGVRLTNWVSREGVGGNRRGEWIFEAEVPKPKPKKEVSVAKTTAPAKTKTKTKTTTTKA